MFYRACKVHDFLEFGAKCTNRFSSVVFWVFEGLVVSKLMCFNVGIDFKFYNEEERRRRRKKMKNANIIHAKFRGAKKKSNKLLEIF